MIEHSSISALKIEVKRVKGIKDYWGIYFSTNSKAPGMLVAQSHSQQEAILLGRELCLDKADEFNTSVEFVVEREN